jgi:hypothetical protein
VGIFSHGTRIILQEKKNKKPRKPHTMKPQVKPEFTIPIKDIREVVMGSCAGKAVWVEPWKKKCPAAFFCSWPACV